MWSLLQANPKILQLRYLTPFQSNFLQFLKLQPAPRNPSHYIISPILFTYFAHSLSNTKSQLKIMEINSWQKHFFPLILAIFFFFSPFPLQTSLALQNDYIRQPPRQVVITPHHRSKSDPQQVIRNHYFLIHFPPFCHLIT